MPADGAERVPVHSDSLTVLPYTDKGVAAHVDTSKSDRAAAIK